MEKIIWRAMPRELFLWRDWDDGSAIYNQQSGRTHILNLTARIILDELDAGPATVSELAARFSLPDGSSPDGEGGPLDLEATLADTLTVLKKEGLVSSCHA